MKENAKDERRRRAPRGRPAKRHAAAEPGRYRLDPPRRLALAGSITVIGLGLVGVGESNVGAVFVLVGLLFFAYAIHTYGRLGAEGASRNP